ncbi:hypothetical protein [Azospirillum sp. sgz302134]
MNEVQNHAESTDAVAMGGESASMAPVISAILGTAVTAAAKRASAADVAHGIIAGLRLLRSAAEDEAGYTMATAIDTAIRTRLLVENLSSLRTTGHEPDPVPLPPPGPGVAIAGAIFVSAAESCLTVNAHADDNEPLELAVFAFASQLLQQLGGSPEWRILMQELHRPSERRDAAQAAALPDGGGTVH